MKKLFVITFLTMLFSGQHSFAAMAESSSKPQLEASASPSLTKKEMRKERKAKKLLDKIQRKFQKLSRTSIGDWSVRDYVIVGLGLLLASVLFFALASVTVTFFNFIGSLSLLGSIVFLILALLKSTGNL